MKLRIAKIFSPNPVIEMVKFSVLFLLLAAPAIGLAQNENLIFGQPNTYGIGPRAIGMGGAFTAIADDASAAYWNPAGLSQINSYEISVSSAPIYFQQDVNPNAN